MRCSFRIGLALGLLTSLVCSGCVQSEDVSGWELVPKKSGAASMEVFPEIPVILPVPTLAQPLGALKPLSTRPIYGMILRKLDEGSLFRRGYSAPTP